MSWETLTPEKLTNAMLASEVAALKSLSLRNGQTGDQLLAELTGEVVSELRLAIGQNASNTLGAAGTLPDGTFGYALSLLRMKIVARVPTLARTFIDEGRKTEYEAARQWMRSKPLVEPPETAAPDSAQIAAATPRITPRSRSFTRVQQDGV